MSLRTAMTAGLLLAAPVGAQPAREAFVDALLGQMTLEEKLGQLNMLVEVTNTGARAGEEVGQLYLRDDVASVTQPVRRLRGFRRVVLNPGETQTITFALGPDDFMLYDEHLQPTSGRYTVLVRTLDLVVTGGAGLTPTAEATAGAPLLNTLRRQ